MNIFTQIHTPEEKKHEEPIILIHGSWGSSTMWNHYIQHFVSNGWTVYTLDLRGHGKSEGTVEGATMQDYANDIATVVEQNNITNPIIIGHSMGGLIVLMYAGEHGAKAVVAMDPSPTQEVQGPGEEKTYAPAYSPMDAGMPRDPQKVMEALPDVPQEMLMKLKDMLGLESGVARSERKLGISIPKEKLPMPLLFIGGELGESVPFGIGIKTAQKMADYYEREVIEIKGATHPGILVGEHAPEAVQHIEEWLLKNV